jgi:outer membrane protein assembly factor BamB
MADTTGYGVGDQDDEPILDIRPLSDVVPLEGIDIIDVSQPADADGQWISEQPPLPAEPVGRPVVGSTLTGIGVAGTIVAAALPWSGGRGLLGIRGLAAGDSWLVWLLLAVGAAAVLGVLALTRPRRRARWWGAAVALAGAALSGWAFVGLPDNEQVGVGPALACAALTVLAAGQLVAALNRADQPVWRWRPAGIASGVVVVVLAAAGVGGAGLADATDIDATTANGALVALTGAAPSAVDRRLWGTTARIYDVAGSVALVVGEAQHGSVTLAGVGVLDLRTGAERWHHYERGWIVREAALTDDGSTVLTVVDTGDETDAVGIDVASGAVSWRQRLAASINCVGPGTDQITPVGDCAGQLVTGDGLLYLGATGRDGVTPATYLNGHDGRMWPVALGAGCRIRGAGADASGVYVLDQCVTAGFPEPHLISERVLAYSLDGRPRWSVPLDLVRGTVAGSYGPVFVRGDVVLVEQEQRYVALTTANGTQLWTSTDGFEPETTVTDGTRLAWSTGVQVAMLDLHTGSTLWQQNWTFPEEADLPLMAGGRLYLIRHTIGPNPYTCAVHATLLTLDPLTGNGIGNARLPGDAGNDCGPDVQDRSFLRGPLLVLLTANTITVLSGH